MPVNVVALMDAPLFSELGERELGLVAAIGAIERAPKGKIVVVEGDAAEGMYVILQGKANVFLSNEAGREVILSVLWPGDFFGEMSLFDGMPRAASVRAVEDLTMVRLDKQAFLSAVKKSPTMALALVGGLVSRLRDADRRIGDLTMVDVSGRVARFLLDRSVEQDGVFVVRPVPKRTEIAASVSASREMVSRVMGALERSGHIRTERHSILLLGQAHPKRGTA